MLKAINLPLRLRAMEPEDLELLFACENDPAVWHLSSSVGPYSRKAVADFIANSHHDIYIDRQLRLVAETDRGEPVGFLDLFDFCPVHQRAGVGILICNEQRGKHLAAPLLSLLANYAFNQLVLRQLYCHVAVNNEPSLRAFATAGYQIVGTCRAWTRQGTHFIDAHFLQLLHPQRTD